MKQKTDFNRIFRSLLSLSAITLFTITACTVESDKGVRSELFIINKTSHSVNIKTFDFGREKPVYDISLNSGEEWYEVVGGDQEGGAVRGFAGDSALYTFDDTLQISFIGTECIEDSIQANILCESSWKSIDPSGGVDVATKYIVTEEVYQLAE